MSLGAAIKALRTQRGWSQEELADRAGTTTATISRIETGRHGATDTLKRAIAQVFGLTLIEFVTLSEDAAPAPSPEKIGLKPDEAELLEAFRRLRGERRVLLLEMARSLSRKDSPA